MREGFIQHGPAESSQTIARIDGDRDQLGVLGCDAGDDVARDSPAAPGYEKQIGAAAEVFEEQVAIPGIACEGGLLDFNNPRNVSGLEAAKRDRRQASA